MKKSLFIIIIIIIIFIFISLAGCGGSYYYNYEDLKETVEKVEIIEITNEGKTAEDFKLIRILNDKEMDELLEELAKVEFIYPFGTPRELSDTGIKMYYSNEEYEIVSRLATKRYKDDVEIDWRMRYCSKEDFDNLVSKYLNE